MEFTTWNPIDCKLFVYYYASILQPFRGANGIFSIIPAEERSWRQTFWKRRQWVRATWRNFSWDTTGNVWMSYCNDGIYHDLSWFIIILRWQFVLRCNIKKGINDRDAICINKKWDLMGSESETNRNGDVINRGVFCFKQWDEYSRHFSENFSWE